MVSDWTDLQYDESDARIVAGLFDADYYLQTNPDVHERHIQPLAHFLSTGWRENRNPNPDFDMSYYKRANPDVAAANINPLVHFALCGALEGRLPRRPLDTLRAELERARSPRVRVKDWEASADRSPALDRPALARILTSAANASAAFVISVSHDDYERNLGGIQNVVRSERFIFERMNWIYLHLSPMAPLPMLSDAVRLEDFQFVIRLGADRLGVANAADLKATLSDLRGDGCSIFLVIHHFMGHSPEVLTELATLALEPILVWTHDYFTLCPNYNLLRNDVRFCNAPPVTSGACGICIYGTDRVPHAGRLSAFFDEVRPLVLAPSATALNFWRARGNLSHRKSHVQPLARLVLVSERLHPMAIEPGVARHDGCDPQKSLRIAHLGMRTLHKGWTVFEELARRHARDPRFKFYQLGVPYGAALPYYIQNVHVHVSHERPDAMIEAIAEHRIDVVVSWSFWPETFCFAAHEALAGGAFVLARKDAGNVADVIESNAPTQGFALDTEDSLFALFESGRLGEMLCQSWRRRGILIAESNSAAWLPRMSGGIRTPAGHRH